MLKRVLRVALMVVAAATHSSWACAQSAIKTHIMDEQVVQKLATSLDHTSMVEFPEAVTAAVVGTEGVKMEFRDNVVILEPQRAGIQTNLLVWAAGKQLVYEIQPASETSEWPFVIRETFAPAPPVGPSPTSVEAMELRDSSHGAFLLSMRNITVCKETQKGKGVHMWAVQVGEDNFSYYVRMTAVNRTKRPYRITTPSVSHIIPAFGGKITPKSVNQQLTPKQLSKIKLYDSEEVASHGSTLTSRDLEPKESVSWVMAVSKVGHPVAIYQFSLPPDGKNHVKAAVIF